ncbi:hypothetical protein EV356DRAFT_121962 [Viridothelium virens]|uniref:Shelterin complex subunit TPP1/Est3 domain-containing protein n=1 Tax=Viridothelium virens TaxID=1048519 RepID=A0A6A6HB53_VIRVR|nr:hypothetical protein EV356DRAFT_121962 [Viridothelium virens]
MIVSDYLSATRMKEAFSQFVQCGVNYANFISFEGDIEAQVSDGKYSCRAIFSADCVTTFNNAHDRPLTQLKGCLFKIADCAFTAALHGGFHKRITLFIDSMKWVMGHVGEPTYGSLTPITENELVLEFLEALKPNLIARTPLMPSLEGQVTHSASSTIARPQALNEGDQSTQHSSRQAPAQRSPLPRSSVLKRTFRGDPVWTEEPGVQQGIRENSSGDEAASPKKNSPNRITAVAMDVSSDSAELPRNPLSQSSRSGHPQSNIKPSADSESAIPWAGVEIRRSLARVPKDQQALLDREESWYPPDPGRRFPIANIPLRTLQQLNAAAEENAKRQRQTTLVHNNGGIGDNDRADDMGAESLSEPKELEEDQDKPFSSEEWPESPARNGANSLPPDSSDHITSEDSPDRSKKLPFSPANSLQKRQPTNHNGYRNLSRRRSLSDDSLIEYSLPQAVKEASSQGAQIDIRSSMDQDQRPSAESSEHKSVAFQTKRTAESPSHGVYLKRMKRMEKNQRKISSPEPSPRPTDYKLERIPSTPTPKTLSSRPNNTARSVSDVEQGMHGEISLHLALPEQQGTSDVMSSLRSSKSIDAHHVQIDREESRIKSKHLARPSQQQTRANSEVDRPSPTVDIFERFTRAYPEYSGDRKHFHNLCQKLNKLQADGKAQHRSHWDDYIIRHKTEYASYLARVNAEGEDPMSYDEYYRHEIEEPLTRQRIINPANLKMAIEQALVIPSGQRTPALGTTVRPESQAGTSRSLSQNTPTDANLEVRPERSSGGNEGQRRDVKVVRSPRYERAFAQQQNRHPITSKLR